jgi:hypothetical protein
VPCPEKVDDTVVRIVDPTTVLESQIMRRLTGREMDLQGREKWAS